MASDEEQIRALIQAWQVATAEGDTDAVLGLMTDDVVFLVAGRPPMRKAEFAAASRASSGSSRPLIQGKAEIQEVQVSGDLAYAWTYLSVSVTPPGTAGPIERSGPALSILRRVGGKWLLARDANLLSPRASPAAAT
ncbi:YybH family protein [Burkholderiaceae bacterium UC74_6]